MKFKIPFYAAEAVIVSAVFGLTGCVSLNAENVSNAENLNGTQANMSNDNTSSNSNASITNSNGTTTIGNGTSSSNSSSKRKQDWDPIETQDKPVIYLYPQETEDVSVSLTVEGGELTCTYPAYEGGWNITAQPDGTLQDDDGREYNYLYYEAEAPISADFSQGFCVRGEDTAEFLERALAEQGLTDTETDDFITYWLPRMQGNEYNVIEFNNEEHAKQVSLNVSPFPDTSIRIFMTWYGSDSAVDIEPQSFELPERDGFTLVEWGGTEI